MDQIEAEGVRRARRRAKEADLLLLVFAADQEPDTQTLGWLTSGCAGGGK